MSTRPRIAVLGASGYTGKELRRLARAHPHLDLAHAMTARPGHKPPDPDLPCDDRIEPLELDALEGCQGVFLCTPHGAAADLAVAALERDCRVVDLSADFRLRDPEVYAATYGQEHRAPALLAEAVYGLTEHQRERVAEARLVANPGCYPTSILLPLLPLLQAGLLEPDAPIVADSKSGVSGAGKTPKDRTVYGAIAENFLAYGVGEHRHSPEVWQEAGTDRVVFVPHLVPMFRGMLSTLYLTPGPGTDATAVRHCLAERYRAEPFVQVFDQGQPETGRVAHGNQCHIAVAACGPLVVVTSAIDNLGKGAAGQALQNMNVMLGLPETAGLDPREVAR